ncbi:nucleotidyltransferase domain-containing protein [Ruminococcus flavefaciens]|uniref:nucleotidyltransferase domain-containing protein n=1 Tax=Ruminococcus flavefaciens TaxID=1265 RepID=UPI00048F3CF1|nr:nucleotidyltransferase family protein [Ruminococcus flavefaciens]
MNTVYKDLIYLLSCSVNGITPDADRIKSMDLDKLYELAKKHTVRGAVCIALERAGIKHERFHDAYKKAVRKNIYLDMERAKLLSEFEKQEIWYMPLKGSVLKDIYPENGMREMADNDVLYDQEYQEKVRDIMTAQGYSVEHFGKGNHDVYHKPPVLNFELHISLFGEQHAEPLFRYYSDVRKLMKKDEGNSFGYHFSDEDFYVYITAHEWKHYSGGGTGIRSLLDSYVYITWKGESVDWKYIEKQLRQLEIADFEQERRQLAIKVFSSAETPELTESEQAMLMNYLTAGTYGTVEKRVRNKLAKQSKPSYILHNMFPSVKYMRESVEFVDKIPALYPVGIVYRWGRIVTKRRKVLSAVVKALKKKDKA